MIVNGIVFFLILAAAAMSDPGTQIISPEDGLETVRNDLVAGWTDPIVNHTHFIIRLGSAGSTLKEWNTTDLYANLNSLVPGDYSLEVLVADGPNITGSSEKVHFSVYPIPGFSVATDLSEYETSGAVIFRIEAPLGSSLDINAKSADDSFAYNPESLATKEFRTFLDPGDYDLTANLSYLDYRTSYASAFTLLAPAPSSVQETQPASSEESDPVDDDALYLWTLTTVDSESEPIPSVAISYRKMGENGSYPSNGTSVTGSDGKKTLLLKAGSYIVDYYKEGYLPATRLVELEYINVTQDVKLQTDPGRMLLSELFAPNITILSPSGGSKVKGPEVKFVYTADDDPEQCQLLLSTGGGWEVKGQEKPLIGENIIMAHGLSPGAYTARIRCVATGKESSSRDLSFSVFVAERDDSIANPTLESIAVAKKKIDSLEAEHRRILDPLSAELAGFEDEINRLNYAYNQAIMQGAVESEVTATREALSGKVAQVKGAIPVDISVTEAENKAVYLPVSGFEDIFGEYLEAAGREATRSAVKKAKAAQEEFMARIEMKEIRVTREDGRSETSIAVEESISSFIQGNGFEVILSIEDPLAQEAVTFISPAEQVSPRFYRTSMESSGSIMFLFSGGIPQGSAKDIKTLIVIPEDAAGTEATGFTVFENGIGGSNVIYYIIITVALAVGVSGSMVYFSPGRVMKKKADKVARGIHKVLDHIDSGRHNQAFELLPRVVRDHRTLSKRYQDDLSPILQHIHSQLEDHNLQNMLTRMESMLMQLGRSYDQKAYEEFLGLYGSMITAYNNSGEELKARHYGKVDQMYQIINELEHTEGL